MLRRFVHAIVVLAFIFSLSALPRVASAQTSGTLFFTTYSAPASDIQGTLNKMTYSFTGNSLALGAPELLHSFGSEGVDAMALLPDTTILIGGKDGSVHNVRANGSLVGNFTTGGAEGFHISFSPNGKNAYTAGLPGQLSRIPIGPTSNGTGLTLTGDDTQITSIAFVNNNNDTAFYTSSSARGDGNFGIIDLNTLKTTRKLSNLPAAHGLVFDQFSQTLILAGANHITQIFPGAPDQIVSDFQINLGDNTGSDRFDQLVTDGSGRLFATVNDGTMLFMNYNFSQRVGAPGNFVATQFVAPFLTGVGLVPKFSEPPSGVPLPAAVWSGMSLIGGMGVFKFARKRRAANG